MFGRQQQLDHKLEVDFFQIPSAALLQSYLTLQQCALGEDLAPMESDLQAVQDDAGFKRWLKTQTKMSR